MIVEDLESLNDLRVGLYGECQSKTFKTGTFTYTLSRFARCKLFVDNNIIEYLGDSKSADLRVLGVRLPLPAPTFPVGSEVPTVPCPLLRCTLVKAQL
jgi:hypothetical protein